MGWSAVKPETVGHSIWSDVIYLINIRQCGKHLGLLSTHNPKLVEDLKEWAKVAGYELLIDQDPMKRK